MPVIHLETLINAPIERCFDLSRSIDLHQISTAHTGEKAIDGRTSGLIEQGEFVTWKAKHFGIWQKLSSRITAMDRPVHFRDEQISGAFASILHDHHFREQGGQTLMTDDFRFEAPLGILGKLVSRLILTSYLQKLLVSRNALIKEFAETEQWKKVLPAG